MYLDDLWHEVKSMIKKSEYFDDTIYETYFDNSQLTNLNNNKAVIAVDSYFQQLILSNEISVISSSLSRILNIDDIECEIVIKNEGTNTPIAQFSKPVEKVIQEDGVSPNHTFENFVVGSVIRKVIRLHLDVPTVLGNSSLPYLYMVIPV